MLTDSVLCAAPSPTSAPLRSGHHTSLSLSLSIHRFILMFLRVVLIGLKAAPSRPASLFYPLRTFFAEQTLINSPIQASSQRRKLLAAKLAVFLTLFLFLQKDETKQYGVCLCSFIKDRRHNSWICLPKKNEAQRLLSTT